MSTATHNPAVTAEQYRLAQAVLSGTARDTHMSEAAAREIVDRTPKRLRSKFMKQNQGIVGSALGYSLVPVVGRTADRATRSILGRRNGKRRNSQRAAAGTYRDFHGREPEVDTVIETEMHEHSVLPGIGELCWMVVRYETDDDEIQDVTLKDFDGALLAMNEQRNHLPQLFIEGGDQKVDLKQFEIGPPLHEHETLGRMVCVAYYTTKDHLGDEGGEAEFVHVVEMPVDMAEFKEWGLDELARSAGLSNADYFAELEDETEGAQGPDVIYDTRNKLMLLSGGTYTLPDEGIDH